jgi:hypothetical protein
VELPYGIVALMELGFVKILVTVGVFPYVK